MSLKGAFMGMLLEARNLCFSYTRRPVLTGLDLSLERGEIVFLRGINGSGKSTLLRCLAGQLRPRAGAISFLGRPLFSLARKGLAGLALVPDVPAFYDDLTGREHLELVSRANGDEEAERRALALAEAFRLADALDALPSALSRGMRYKLALTLALAMRSKVLLLDEPFAPIDADAARVLGAELDKLSAEGSAVLLSIHGSVPTCIPTRTLCLDDHGLHEEIV